MVRGGRWLMRRGVYGGDAGSEGLEVCTLQCCYYTTVGSKSPPQKQKYSTLIFYAANFLSLYTLFLYYTHYEPFTSP